MEQNGKRHYQLTEKERYFLKLANDSTIRPDLLDRLAQLELLPAFLSAESGTN